MEKKNKNQPDPDNQPEKARKEQLLVQNSTEQSGLPIPKPVTGEKQNEEVMPKEIQEREHLHEVKTPDAEAKKIINEQNYLVQESTSDTSGNPSPKPKGQTTISHSTK